jgi:hypothetical protein
MLSKLGTEGNVLNLVTGVHETPTAYTTPDSERLEAYPQEGERGKSLVTLILVREMGQPRILE